MQIITVLKESEEYGPEHFYYLLDSILCFNPTMDVYCFTDSSIKHPNVCTIPLLHNWEGWWSKIEMFRSGLFYGKSLYLDIDSIVLGDLSNIQIDGFTMLPNILKPGDWGSGAMGWENTPHHIYREFKERPDYYIQEYITTKKWGDQGFIRDHVSERPLTFGSEFRSYKMECRDGVPENTKVLYFHGQPRPWDIKDKRGRMILYPNLREG